ncbi:MAG: helix-turn-helix domain-containing protein [Proteobacteria bacterium]|nr:helix-turn-helix domain-containing protein [Pseudomonadota bacterium]
MDSLITAAARALARGDPLGALKRVALRGDPAALALRGTALAQLGDLARARALLRAAARAFGAREAVARARCVVAEAEIALALRDLTGSPAPLRAASALLAAHGDRVNAAHARYLDIRRRLLLGRLDEAEGELAHLEPADLPPPLRAAHELVVAGIAVRRIQARDARRAFERAARAAHGAGIPALVAEVEAAAGVLAAPAARIRRRGATAVAGLAAVEALLGSADLLVDACRYRVRDGRGAVDLARRPVLFALAQLLAEAWPGDVPRDVLIARAFRGRHADDSYRARLRVEIGRLRRAIRPLAAVEATPLGFALRPRRASEVIVLVPPSDAAQGAVLALLSDGEAWSSSALALALGASARTVQRELEALGAAGQVQAVGRGRSRRWMTPLAPAFATILLLPSPPTAG